MAEAFNSLFKAELDRNNGAWRSIDDLEVAVAENITWFNRRRLHGAIGLLLPAELKTQHHAHDSGTADAAPAPEILH